ncbi:MAG TPA: hypothetical protein DGU45_10900, partial [Planctomycetes bacterium]|nr:hypothetical protein [Planctomycetota bacterium]
MSIHQDGKVELVSLCRIDHGSIGRVKMPKNQQSFHKRWGLLFFLLITLTLVSQLPLPDLANASEEQISFSLEDVGLIETGTLVTFRGHPIGKVHSIEFIEKLEAENSDASLPLFVAHANISRN